MGRVVKYLFVLLLLIFVNNLFANHAAGNRVSDISQPSYFDNCSSCADLLNCLDLVADNSNDDENNNDEETNSLANSDSDILFHHSTIRLTFSWYLLNTAGNNTSFFQDRTCKGFFNIVSPPPDLLP